MTGPEISEGKQLTCAQIKQPDHVVTPLYVTQPENFHKSLASVEGFLGQLGTGVVQAPHNPELCQHVLTICHHFTEAPEQATKIRAIIALTRIKLDDRLEGTEIQDLSNQYVQTDRLDDKLNPDDLGSLATAAAWFYLTETTPHLANELLGYVAEKKRDAQLPNAHPSLLREAAAEACDRQNVWNLQQFGQLWLEAMKHEIHGEKTGIETILQELDQAQTDFAAHNSLDGGLKQAIKDLVQRANGWTFEKDWFPEKPVPMGSTPGNVNACAL